MRFARDDSRQPQIHATRAIALFRDDSLYLWARRLFPNQIEELAMFNMFALFYLPMLVLGATIPQILNGFGQGSKPYLLKCSLVPLEEYGNIRIGRAGIRIYTGRFYITAHESVTIGMTYNDAMNHSSLS